MGGIIIGQEVAKAIGHKRVFNVPHVFAERTISGFQFRRGLTIPKDTNVIIVEDVVTTGRSVMELSQLIRMHGGNVVAVASMINRSNNRDPFPGAHYVSIVSTLTTNWDPEDCPLCNQGIPTEKPGSHDAVHRLL